MNRRNLWFVLVPISLVLVLSGLLTACSSGVSQSDYDAAKSQLATAQQQVTNLQGQLDSANKQIADLQAKLTAAPAQSDLDAAKSQLAAAQQQVTSVQGQLDTANKQIADLQAKLAAAPSQSQLAAAQQQVISVQGQLDTANKQIADLQQKLTAATSVTPLIAAQKVTGTPPPPPPPPNGPPPTPPPSLYQPVGPFYCSVEPLTAGEPGPSGIVSGPVCAISGVFERGEKIVWRFEVIDLSTGKRVTDQDAASVSIQLPNNQSVKAEFSQRAGGMLPNAPWSWAAAWDIPADYPVGSLPYSISIATKDGRTGTWAPADLDIPQAHISSELQIVN